MVDERKPTFGSLFAGIGGIDLGLERAGWECRFQVEWDAYCTRVLAKHWPDVPRYGDITGVDWSGVERVDLLAGGFPCQPVSHAGRRLAQDDVRWLWPEFRRAVGALRPQLVLVENVPGLLARGLGDVLGDLATLGYDTEWDCIPAAAVGAPHLRDRVWLVAHADRFGCMDGSTEHHSGELGHSSRSAAISGGSAMANTPSLRGSALGPALDESCRTNGTGRGGAAVSDADGGYAQGFIEERNDQANRREPRERPARLFSGTGQHRAWPAEPDVGRVAHGVPARVDRLRALGNAVVPQVVEVIGNRLRLLIEDVN